MGKFCSPLYVVSIVEGIEEPNEFGFNPFGHADPLENLKRSNRFSGSRAGLAFDPFGSSSLLTVGLLDQGPPAFNPARGNPTEKNQGGMSFGPF
ncbi:hypothetical protein V6N13_064824 [Hibiscus sabdariffa]